MGDSNSKQQRAWTEWWGVNLWVNLSRYQTDKYLNVLRTSWANPISFTIAVVDTVLSITDFAIDIIFLEKL